MNSLPLVQPAAGAVGAEAGAPWASDAWVHAASAPMTNNAGIDRVTGRVSPEVLVAVALASFVIFGRI